MLVCMVMNSLPLAFEGDLSVSMDKSLARRNVENKSLGAPAVGQGHPSSRCLPGSTPPPPPPFPTLTRSTLLGFKSAQIYDLN